jgi:hypothetical protein
MEAHDTAPTPVEPSIGTVARTELFVGRVVTGAAIGEVIGLAIDNLGPDALNTDPGNTAVAALALGLIYAVKNRRNPR